MHRSPFFFGRSLHRLSVPMADARRVRAERRAAHAARVAQTAPPGDGNPRRSPSPAADAATGPVIHEQQDSSLPLPSRRDGHTATPSPIPAAASSSHARRGPANSQAALLMARELLRYRPADDLYEEWLDRIAELVSAAGEAPASSRSLPPPPPRAGDPAHGVPLPPLGRDVIPEPRREAPPRGQPQRAPAHDEESCQVVQRPQGEGRALQASPR